MVKGTVVDSRHELSDTYAIFRKACEGKIDVVTFTLSRLSSVTFL